MIFFTKSQVGLAPKYLGKPVPRKLDEVIVHHSYLPNILCGQTIEEEMAAVLSIDSYHDKQGWGGIGYNFCITQNGHVYEGRGWGRSGAHTEGKNSTTVGVCFIVDGSLHSLSPAAIDAFKQIVQEGLDSEWIREDFTLSPHDAYKNKVCPGPIIKSQFHQLNEISGWPTIRLSSRGEAVKHLQKFLIAQGLLGPGHATGYFGTLTKDAVIKFQKANNIDADGVVGPDTWKLVP